MAPSSLLALAVLGFLVVGSHAEPNCLLYGRMIASAAIVEVHFRTTPNQMSYMDAIHREWLKP